MSKAETEQYNITVKLLPFPANDLKITSNYLNINKKNRLASPVS